ncbi:MAG: hypothetical protein KAY24_10540 [Candidatus Eisenbacteria sp.]|nr:hypothetical protein [Candidatus Eisenbacteria bacterium]
MTGFVLGKAAGLLGLLILLATLWIVGEAGAVWEAGAVGQAPAQRLHEDSTCRWAADHGTALWGPGVGTEGVGISSGAAFGSARSLLPAQQVASAGHCLRTGTCASPSTFIDVPPLCLESGGAPQASVSNRRALATALMSAIVPGAGQMRNGSLLRGLGYFTLEVTGWVAHQAFDSDSESKTGEISAFAESYWNYERYKRVAQDADSCDVYGCPYSNNGDPYWTADRDSTIQTEQTSGSDRFREYITRDPYACGWDTSFSRSLYLDIWNEREDLLSSKRLVGRLIFLNHLVSAVDAFLEARRFRVKLGENAELDLQLRGLPFRANPRLVVSARLN